MTVERLQNDSTFQLLRMLRHDEVMPFVQEEFSSGTQTIRAYLGLNLALLLWLLFVAWSDLSGGALGWVALLKYFGLGIFLVFTLLIPLHEGLHGLAYKMVGAPRVSYGVNWKKFYFFAVADHFVVRRNAFIFIALAPFVVISALALAAVFFVSPEMKWLLFGVLFLHTGACAGDFAMLSFYEKYRACPDMLTFDDVPNNTSFFYIKEN